MVGNFGKRLKPYNMTVKELTGDMNLSRAEIEEAQVCMFFRLQPAAVSPCSQQYVHDMLQPLSL